MRAAVHILRREGTPRERLAQAYTRYLLGLNPKEMPTEIRPDFVKLIQWAKHQKDGGRHTASDLFNFAKDAEVSIMVGLVIDMYDAVTRYEPILSPPTPPAQHLTICRDLTAA